MTLYLFVFEFVYSEFNRSIACVLCFTKAVESIKKCFNYVIIILIQNAGFDTANAAKENVAFVFVIGAVEYEMISFFLLLAYKCEVD